MYLKTYFFFFAYSHSQSTPSKKIFRGGRFPNEHNINGADARIGEDKTGYTSKIHAPNAQKKEEISFRGEMTKEDRDIGLVVSH